MLSNAVSPQFPEQSPSFQITATRHELQTGPFPPPAILKAYDGVVPGAAERIIKMAEEESRHRRDIESRVARAQVRDAFLSRIIEFSGVLAGLTMGIVTVVYGTRVGTAGQPWLGGSVSLGGLAALVGVFVYGRSYLLKIQKEAKTGALTKVAGVDASSERQHRDDVPNV